jgi:hypothetical protein
MDLFFSLDTTSLRNQESFYEQPPALSVNAVAQFPAEKLLEIAQQPQYMVIFTRRQFDLADYTAKKIGSQNFANYDCGKTKDNCDGTLVISYHEKTYRLDFSITTAGKTPTQVMNQLLAIAQEKFPKIDNTNLAWILLNMRNGGEVLPSGQNQVDYIVAPKQQSTQRVNLYAELKRLLKPTEPNTVVSSWYVNKTPIPDGSLSSYSFTKS